MSSDTSFSWNGAILLERFASTNDPADLDCLRFLILSFSRAVRKIFDEDDDDDDDDYDE